APGAQSSVANGALRPSASRARLGAAPLFMNRATSNQRRRERFARCVAKIADRAIGRYSAFATRPCRWKAGKPGSSEALTRLSIRVAFQAPGLPGFQA